ncbi:molybdopterin-dependent oxidoreductase [Actinomycetospora sp. NBRC 106378]|uniref:molybdopterin-dependent oxidoreductase n=1 Tax=Actinomycetospora sp. NBRC 106378 TaxID=3032208 RepID=UPI0024A1B720|nr:molybdopterin-dependent oxidoreductase [Actinomycetospora sp. NBRC 106378]GLZ50943.1 molybdopterin-binding protein [Actinomycetospora sp. NBRC 106378]
MATPTADRSSIPPALDPGPRGGRTVLAAVLAVAASIGLGELVAALVSPAASPFLAVGQGAIRLTPEWLKETAIAWFGTYDKVALLVGMSVVIVAVTVLAGLASRRDPRPGLVLVVGMGLLALLATVTGPTFAPFDLVPPVVALLVGVVVWRWLHGLAVAPATEGGETSPAGAVTRKRFLTTAGVTAVGALAAGTVGRLVNDSAAGPASVTLPPAPAAAPVPVDADFVADGTPPWLTPAADFYRIDTALSVPRISTGDWSLKVHGMVDREVTLSFDQLRSMRLIEAPVTLTCVSNEVGGTLISNGRWLGVPMRDVLALAGVRPGAEQIASTSADGWNANTPLGPLTDGRNAMLAIGLDGAPLPVEHGFPVRMVVPGLYGYVSATKWITDIEVTTFDAFTSYWEQRGWGKFGPVKTSSRIDVPRDGATVPAGRTVAAGVAWAQHTGITGVELSVDGGPWQPAQLAAEPSVDSWRMWRLPLTLAPGAHQLRVRAVDRTGAVQTGVEALSIPDGATGWHTVAVTAV